LLVTISIFKFQGFANKVWAFKAMGKTDRQLTNIEGLVFSKMMGSGATNGFGIWPNFGTYALICTWQTEALAMNFFNNSSVYETFLKKSHSNLLFKLQTIASHGTWNKENPFLKSVEPIDNEPIAVITRGKIKLSKIFTFWRNVPLAAEKLSMQDGLLFSIGIGELPLIQQATFSIWQNTEKMKAYAYKNLQHTAVIQKTKQLNWYSEDLFARFKFKENTEFLIEELNDFKK
jgi:hypothetical protein